MIFPRLTSKSRIKVVLPASSVAADKRTSKNFAAGYDLLKQNFVMQNSQYWKSDFQGLAASDQERADEINDASRTKTIDAIIAGRGGYGSLRLLSMLDFEMIRENPKAMIGFSDLTILQLAIFLKTGLISLSGPMVNTISEESLTTLIPLLTQDTSGKDLLESSKDRQIEIINEGKAEGILLGGNLFSMVQLIGTGFLPRLDNALLFLEDVDETVDHLDSFLHHLKLVGLLYKVTGVIFGDTSWRKIGVLPKVNKQQNLFRQRISGFFRKEMPIIMGVPYGHVDDTITIPIGAKAVLDTSDLSLTLTESVTRG